MNKEQDKDVHAYWNILRGTVDYFDYITAAVLIKTVRDRVSNLEEDETSDVVYSTLLEIADEMDIKNPFMDKDSFLFAYQESKQFERMDWEGAIAEMAHRYRMPLIPEPILKLYEKRFSKDTAKVLIAEAEKFVPNLMRIVDEHINSDFVLTTQSPIFAKALESVFDEYENVDVLLTDIYQYEFVDRRFDLIFSCPNFAVRTLTEDRTFMCREQDMVALENLSLHLNSGGRLVITVPGRIAFASGKVNDLRKFIQTNYTIREIGELPERTFECTGIKLYLLDIENTRPGDDEIIIRRYMAEGRKTRCSEVMSLAVADDTFVMPNELEEQGDWSIDRIFAQQDEEYLNYQKSKIRKERIGNVAQIFRGKAVTRKEPSGNIGVVNITNIGDYEIDYDGLTHLQMEERKVANYILQEGDVLLPARGTAIRTAVFHEQSYPCIASSNVIVIRPNAKELNSYYLKLFLDSPIGNKLISGAQQGVIIMNISYKDLNVLEVPMPVMSEQETAVREYLDELRKYQETIAAAQQRWNDVLNKLQKF